MVAVLVMKGDGDSNEQGRTDRNQEGKKARETLSRGKWGESTIGAEQRRRQPNSCLS